MEKERFHSTVAKLLYLAMRVRPDIFLAVYFLSTRVREPSVEDSSNKLNRVLGYLKGTPRRGIILKANLPIGMVAYVE